MKFTWAPVDKLSVVNRVNLMLETLYFSTPARKRNRLIIWDIVRETRMPSKTFTQSTFSKHSGHSSVDEWQNRTLNVKNNIDLWYYSLVLTLNFYLIFYFIYFFFKKRHLQLGSLKLNRLTFIYLLTYLVSVIPKQSF